MDVPKGMGLVLDPFLDLHLVLTMTRVTQGNIDIVRPIGGVSMESIALLVG